MSNATLSLLEISRDQWTAVLADVTRDNLGAHARLEVVGPHVDYQVETEDRLFDGIAVDTKNHECVVWMHFGDLDHGIQGVIAIRMLPRVGEIGPLIEVEDLEGVKTTLTLSGAAEYELPPA
jgi:hypothetical protein